MLTKQKQQLKAKAHKLKPVVQIGNKGYTDAVEKEINLALDDHELIKVRISTQDKVERKQVAEKICENLKAELVQSIGMIAVLYRKNEKDEA